MTAQKKNPQPDGNLIGDAYRGGTLGDTKIVSPPNQKIKEVMKCRKYF